ncbi:hypothetical protein K1X76_08570 [bacterium]|nr:hypothetical protein [bacterium]
MQLIKKITPTILTITSLFVLSACGGAAGGGSSSSGGGSYSGANLEGGAVTQVTLDSNNTGSITFPDSSPTAEYVLAMYSYDDSGSSSAFEIANSLSGPDALEQIITRSQDNNENMTEDFHGWLRDQESLLPPNEDNNAQTRSAGITRAVEEPIGNIKDFEVLSSLSSGSSFTTVEAELVAKTNNVYCYMDTDDLGSLTTDEVETLVEEFDSHIADERSLFGSESDEDNNDHFYILMTNQVNSLGASQGGIITGFFYAADVIDRDIEVFYTLVPDPSGHYGTAISKSFTKTNILPSVFLHEYQHMINFNMHYYVNDSSTEISAVNEGLSHLAEDLPYNFEEPSLENPARVETYLEQTDSICITCGSSLAQRGGMYLFLKYLYEQADKGNLSGVSSGTEFISTMLNSGLRGVNNIVNAAYGTTSQASERFADLLGQYGLAVFMSNTSLSEDNRFNFDGINLRDSQDDNRGTTLNGPAMYTLGNSGLQSTMAGTSVTYVYITADDVETLGGSLSVQLSDEAVAGAYLIQTGL